MFLSFFKDNTPCYSNIGDVIDGKYYLYEDNKIKGLQFIPEYIMNAETKTPEKSDRYICTLPWYDKNYLRIDEDAVYKCEGLIIYGRIPFMFYYNDSGDAYIKCPLSEFDNYFSEDKKYFDFINFAANYEPEPYNPYSDLTSK